MVEHECIGLFDELGTGHPLGTQKLLDGYRGRGDLGHEEWLQLEVANKLFVEPALGIPPVEQPVGQCRPGGCRVAVTGPD